MELSGTHRVALSLMDAASDAGLTCRALVCMNDKIGLSERDSRIQWPNRRHGKSESLLTKVIKTLAALRQATQLAQEADIVLAVCPPSTVIGWWAGLRSSTPVIGWVHYDVKGRKRETLGATNSRIRDWIQNRLYYNFMPRMPYLAFVSHATANNMARDRKLETLPLGWRTLPNIFQRTSTSDASTTLQYLATIKERREPIVIFLGRLAHQKRWEDALQAAIELQALGVAAQWVFLGDGPEKKRFLAAMAVSPIKERLHWLGSDPNALPVLAQTNALVLTSRYEAWPTVILEAFDLGIPVVSYNCPSGPAEMLGHQERGWLTPEDPRSLAIALAERFSPSCTEEVRLRCVAGRSFLAAHQPKKVMKEWLDYFETILASKSKPLRRQQRKILE